MIKPRTVAHCVVAAALAYACHSGVGEFGKLGYQHPEYPYSVRYSDEARQLLMPDDWQLDNFYDRGHGLVPKTGDDYEATLYLDVNGDGKSDDVGTVPLFDLRFTHRRTTAVVWLRTVPIEQRLRDKELRVLMDGIVSGISGGGYRTVELEGSLYETNNEQRYAAKVVRSMNGKLAGRDAYAVVVDVSNVDRLRVDPKAVEARVMIVLARTGLEERVSGRVRDKFPILLLAEYIGVPSDFDATLPDFVGLLRRITFGGHAGFTLEEAQKTEPVGASAPPVEAPPPAVPESVADGGVPADAAPSVE